MDPELFTYWSQFDINKEIESVPKRIDPRGRTDPKSEPKWCQDDPKLNQSLYQRVMESFFQAVVQAATAGSLQRKLTTQNRGNKKDDMYMVVFPSTDAWEL